MMEISRSCFTRSSQKHRRFRNREANNVRIDVSDAMGKLLTPADITPQMTEAMTTIGLHFVTEGGKLKVISDT